jgi:hypothetical protein
MMGYRFPFPIRVFLPLTLFHVFHASVAAAPILWYLSLPYLAAGCGAIAAWSGIKHFVVPLPRKRFREWTVFLCLRYVMNWSFVAGGIIGGLRNGMINLEPAHDRNAIPEEIDTCA